MKRIPLTDEAWVEVRANSWTVSWPSGHKTVHNVDSLLEVLAQCVRDETVRGFQVGYSKGSGQAYAMGYHDAERMLHRVA